MRRSKRFKKRFGASKELDVDITSLLDILVILLVFLLKSYNPSDLKIDLVKGVTLPDSQSTILGNRSVIVQVNKDKDFWINDKKIGRLLASSDEFPSLYEKLADIKKAKDEEVANIESKTLKGLSKKALERKKKFNKTINIVMDQGLDYGILRKVMHTSAKAGFPEFKFIVQTAGK